MVQIIEMLAPTRENGARSGLPLLGCIGVTIHNTDNWSNGAGAKNHGSYLQNSGASNQASWHYAVDDTCATHSIPDNETAWHAGDGGNGNGNRKTIAIEICVNPDSDLTKATDNAAWLAAKILKAKGLPATAVYQHHDWMDKNCPSQIRAGKPYSWDTFKAKVKAYYDGNNDKVEEAKPTPAPKPTKKEKYGEGIQVCTNTLATSSDGSGKVYKGDWTGWIGRVIAGAKYPYRVDDSNGTAIGWTNTTGIDTDPHTPGSKKRYEDPNGVIYVGDTVCFNTIFSADELDMRNNRVCCHKLIGGKPTQSYHWVDSNPCIEVNAKGQKAGDQVFYIGDKFKIPGDYKVLALDMATNASKVKIGNHETWVKTAYLSKVTYK